MRQSTFMPHSLSLLAGALAALASAHALAETAGRVSFVTGNVTATTPEGQSRALRRGDTISGGDRIETRGGRLQIRFTDGGFVSLQPNTVFGIDQYLYANKAPEETSLFFSLLRGGMRTITGAIGKVNKQSYKVRTPVATIGIRGTGYRATTDNNRTLVSVGHGLVNVENVFGSVTGGMGQNIVATNDRPPALSHEAARITATRPEGDVEHGSKEATDDRALAHDETPVFGDQVNASGDTLLLATDTNGSFQLLEPEIRTLPDTDVATGHPLYSFINPLMFDGAQTGLTATFSQSADAARRGGLLTLADARTLPTAPLFDAGSLQFHDVKTVGPISWGEYTAGTATTNSLFTRTYPLAATEFDAYVIGMTPNPDALPPLGTAKYSLLGGTAPRLNHATAGTLDIFTIDVDFAQASMAVQLGLSLSGESFSATGTGLGFDGMGHTFMLSGLTTTSNGTSCSTTASCSTSVSGFFAGDGRGQIGAAYDMFTDIGTITGAAGLGQTLFTPYVPTLTLASSSATTQTPVFSLAAPIYTASAPCFIHPQLQAQFDQSFTSKRGGLLKLDNANGTVFDSGTLHFNGVSTLNKLSWGEFTDGVAATDTLGNGLTASPTQFEPYIIGYSAPGLLNSGKATYTLQGQSAPRLNESLAGTLDNFSITIDFDFALLDLALGVTANGKTVNVTGNGIPVPGIFMDRSFNLSSSSNQLAVSGSACTSFCSADISGFFAGAGGSQIGAAYGLSTDSGTIKGVAALGIGTPSPAASTLPDMQAYTLALTAVPGATSTPTVSGGYNDGNPMSPSLSGKFDAAGALLIATSEYPSPQNTLTNSSASVSELGTDSTLSWGRYHSGSLSYGANATTVVLTGTDSLHYVIGQETPATMMSALAAKGGAATYIMSSSQGSGVSGSLAADFAAATLGVNMAVDLGTAKYDVTGSMDISGAQFVSTGLSTLKNGGACANSCATDISGFFSGQQAQQIGLTYQINDVSVDTISGAAAFKRSTILP